MSIKIHKNAIKLTGLYLAILMFICFFFSAIVYQLSAQEFDRGIRQQSPETILRRLSDLGTSRTERQELLNEREHQYDLATQHIAQRLIVINTVLLVCGGVLSYFLAVRTLRPIEKARDAQSRFTADASHELRTPIAAMQTETEVALMDPKLTLPKAKEILRSNIEELSKLTALSEGLLNMAKGENVEVEGKKIDVSKLVQTATKKVASLATKKEIVITEKLIPKTTIIGDESRLEEALIIVLDNAIKYSSEKSKVTVAVEQSPKAVSIKITDHGIGIAPKELPYIFDRFYRSDTARSKTKVNGYGIGLAIAKGIIESHDGEITAQSKSGKGTSVLIQLPKIS